MISGKLARKITGLVLIATVAALIIWDIVAVAAGGKEATISRVVYELARDYPVIPFAVGVVCGHIFWFNRPGSKV